MLLVEGFAQVTAQQSSLWLDRGRNLQVFATPFGLAVANLAKAASEPGVAQSGIDLEGALEPADGFATVSLGGDEETLPGQRLGITWAQVKACGQCALGPRGAAVAEFKFRHARPGEAEGRGEFGGAARGSQRR